MISVDLGRRLHEAGVRWEPAEGDRFVIPDRHLDDEIFTVASMVVDVIGSGGRELVRFNGTVEWALDAIERDAVIWLPSETQLRSLLGGAFRSLTAVSDAFQITLEVAGRPVLIEAEAADEAYGLALLYLASGE